MKFSYQIIQRQVVKVLNEVQRERLVFLVSFEQFNDQC